MAQKGNYDRTNLRRPISKSDREASIGILFALAVGSTIALCGGYGGQTLRGISVFAFAFAGIFLVQWLAFVPAFLAQTEKFYDLAGSVTFISAISFAAYFSPRLDGRSALLTVVIVVWAARLGSFLFRRIRKAEKDFRFDEIKPFFLRFLLAWTLQGLWVAVTAAPALAAVTSNARMEFGWFATVGASIWLFGFVFEVVADRQKTRFRENPENNGDFIRTGLWALSRHPNYFGEIVLWFGVSIIAFPVLRGYQWVTLISPFFVAALIVYVSGVPMLEKKADESWGDRENYRAYKKETPLLIPFL